MGCVLAEESRSLAGQPRFIIVCGMDLSSLMDEGLWGAGG